MGMSSVGCPKWCSPVATMPHFMAVSRFAVAAISCDNPPWVLCTSAVAYSIRCVCASTSPGSRCCPSASTVVAAVISCGGSPAPRFVITPFLVVSHPLSIVPSEPSVQMRAFLMRISCISLEQQAAKYSSYKACGKEAKNDTEQGGFESVTCFHFRA